MIMLEQNPAADQPNDDSGSDIFSLLEAARQANDSNDIAEARKLYLQVIEQAPYNRDALQWLANYTTDPHESCLYLERLLVVEPGNAKAHQMLEVARRRSQQLSQDSFSQLLSYLEQLEVHAPDVDENPVSAAPQADVTDSLKMLPPLDLVPPPAPPKPRPIGQVLIECGVLAENYVESAARVQSIFKDGGLPMLLGEILLEFGLVGRDQLEKALSEQLPSKVSFLKTSSKASLSGAK